MLHYKLKLAIRHLLNDKVNSAIILGGFAIGFAAFILIGLFYMSEHRHNHSFADGHNIYRMYDAKQNTANLPYSLNLTLLKHYPDIHNACPLEYVNDNDMIFKDSKLDLHISCTDRICTTSKFFDMFSVEVIASLASKPFNGKKSIVMTESAAKQMYGSVNPLGRTLISDYSQGTITAIIKDIPASASFKAQLIFNTDNKGYRYALIWTPNGRWYTTPHFVQLNDFVDVKEFSDNINNTITEYNPNTDSLAFQNINDIYLSELSIEDSHKKGNRTMLVIFLVIGLLITNVSGLLSS